MDFVKENKNMSFLLKQPVFTEPNKLCQSESDIDFEECSYKIFL